MATPTVINTAPYRDRKNRITPTYREESQFWQLVPGEAVSSPVWVAEDGGEERSVEITLPLVQNAAQAHQLAAYDLANTREFLQFEITAKPKLLAVRVGDCVTVTLPEIAVTGQKCMVVSREFDPATWQVKLTLRSETDAKHAYALGQSQVAPPSPALSSFDPSAPDGPTAGSWNITDHSVTNEAGTVVPAIVISGANDDPTTSAVIFEYRRAGESDWTFAREAPAATTQIVITDVVDQEIYEVAVSYRTVLNIVSERLVIGLATTGRQLVGGVAPGGIDWTETGTPTAPIVNVPPVLTDLDENGHIDGGMVNSGDGTTVAARFTGFDADIASANAEIANARGDTLSAVSTLNQAISDAEDAIEAKIRLTNPEAGSIGSRFLASETKTDTTASKVGGLETVTGDHTSQIATLQTTTATSAIQITKLEASNRSFPNLIKNGDFTNNTAGWAKDQAGTFARYYHGTLGSIAYWNGAVEYVYTDAIAANPGDAFSLSFEGDRGGGDGYAVIQWLPSYAATSGVQLPAEWGVRAKLENMVAPAGTTGARLVFYRGSATQVHLTRVKLNYGATATNWSDEASVFNTNSRLITTETAVNDGRFASAQRATDLEATVNAATGGVLNLRTRVGTVETAVTDGRFARSERAIAIEASLGGALNTNSNFAVPISSGEIPNGWQDWAAGAVNTVVAGQASPNGIQYTVGNNESRGIRTGGYMRGETSPGWYVIEGLVTLNSGLMAGAGIHVQWFDLNGTIVQSVNLDFSLDFDQHGDGVGNGQPGRTYRFSKLVELTNQTARKAVLYVMAGWEGMAGGARAAKTITYHEATLRQASRTEVEVGRAIAGGTGIHARINAAETAFTDGRFASAQRVTDLEAQKRTLPNLCPNSDFSQGLRFWTNGDTQLWGAVYNANIGQYLARYAREGTHRYLISENIPMYGSQPYSISFNGDGGDGVNTNDGTAVYISQYDANGVYIPAGDAFLYTPVNSRDWSVRQGTNNAISHPQAAFGRIVIRKGIQTDGLGISRIMFNSGSTALDWSDNATVRDTNARISQVEKVTTDGSLVSASTFNVLEAKVTNQGGNLLFNTDFESGVAPWRPGGQVWTALEKNAAGEAWHPVGENCLGMNVPTSAGAGYSDITSDQRISVIGDNGSGNAYYEFSCYVACHRANAELFIGFVKADGSAVYASGGIQAVNTGGTYLRDWTRLRVNGYAPADTVSIFPIVRKHNTLSGSDSWIWITRPMVAATTPNAAMMPYMAGSARQLTAQITDARNVAIDLKNRITSTATMTVEAGNRIAGMKLIATDGNDSSYSAVQFVADRFQVYDPNSNNGIAPFEIRNGGVRAKSAFIDRLSVGTSITLGSGIQFKVAVQPIDVGVTDGQSVNFGFDLGANPTLAFAGNNLAPLNAGETYNLYADNLSPTGFIARLKISTPATPANLSTGMLGPNPNGPTSHHIYIDSYGGRSTTGGYNVRVIGYNRIYRNRFGNTNPNLPEYEPDDPSTTLDGETWIGVYGWNGGAWVNLDTIYVGPNWTSSNGYSDQYFDITQTVPTGTNISHIGVAVDYKTYSQSRVDQLGVFWQTQGSGGGLRSATPNGQVSTVTIRPKS